MRERIDGTREKCYLTKAGNHTRWYLRLAVDPARDITYFRVKNTHNQENLHALSSTSHIVITCGSKLLIIRYPNSDIPDASSDATYVCTYIRERYGDAVPHKFRVSIYLYARRLFGLNAKSPSRLIPVSPAVSVSRHRLYANAPCNLYNSEMG